MDMAEIKFTQWQMVKKIKKPPQPLFKHKIFTEPKRKKRRCKKAEYTPQFCLRPFRFWT